MGLRTGIQKSLEARLGNRAIACLASVIVLPLMVVRLWLKAQTVAAQVKIPDLDQTKLKALLEKQCPIPREEAVIAYSNPPSLALSVIMPVYNSAAYLHQTVMSVLEQQTNHQFELICINDGSSDESGSLLQDLSNDSRVVVIHKVNGGIARARNTGLEVARGRWIMFLDSDDLLVPGAIDLMMQRALQEDVDIIAANFFSFSDLAYPGFSPLGSELFHVMDSVGAYSQIKDGFPWGKLYRRELWRNVRFPAGYQFEDSIIKTLLFPMADRIAVTEAAVVGYRVHQKSITSTLNKSPNAGVFVLWLVDKLISEYQRLGLSKDIVFSQMVVQHLTRYLTIRLQHMPMSTLSAVFAYARNSAQSLNVNDFSNHYEQNAWKALVRGRFAHWYFYSSLASLGR